MVIRRLINCHNWSNFFSLQYLFIWAIARDNKKKLIFYNYSKILFHFNKLWCPNFKNVHCFKFLIVYKVFRFYYQLRYRKLWHSSHWVYCNLYFETSRLVQPNFKLVWYFRLNCCQKYISYLLYLSNMCFLEASQALC